MFELATEYARSGMTAYAKLQEREFALADSDGYAAIRHQRFVGTGYFDAVQTTITSGRAATVALEGSTENAQFTPALPGVKALGDDAVNHGVEGQADVGSGDLEIVPGIPGDAVPPINHTVGARVNGGVAHGGGEIPA